MPTLQEWKLARGVLSYPGISCIHKIRREQRRHKHGLRAQATRRAGECCVPPHTDHTHGFKQKADGQPLVVSLTYFNSPSHLERIKSDCLAWSEANRVNVRFSTTESWLDTDLPVVLIEWLRRKPIPAKRRCVTCRRFLPWDVKCCKHEMGVKPEEQN